MVPIVAFVGKANCGKTTFLEKLIRELNSRGLSICAIKHSHHEPAFDEGKKDTFRLREAGALRTVFHGPQTVILVDRGRRTADLIELARQLAGTADLVVAEGYATARVPKIEISRAALYGELIYAESPELIAIVTDHIVDSSLPTFDLEDAAAVADFLIDRFELETESKFDVPSLESI